MRLTKVKHAPQDTLRTRKNRKTIVCSGRSGPNKFYLQSFGKYQGTIEVCSKKTHQKREAKNSQVKGAGWFSCLNKSKGKSNKSNSTDERVTRQAAIDEENRCLDYVTYDTAKRITSKATDKKLSKRKRSKPNGKSASGAKPVGAVPVKVMRKQSTGNPKKSPKTKAPARQNKRVPLGGGKMVRSMLHDQRRRLVAIEQLRDQSL